MLTPIGWAPQYNKTLMDKLKTRMAEDSLKGNSLLHFNCRLVSGANLIVVSGSITPLQTSVLSTLSSYRDLFHPAVQLDSHNELRAAAAMHAMNHVHK